jgi:hypothetical protein
MWLFGSASSGVAAHFPIGYSVAIQKGNHMRTALTTLAALSLSVTLMAADSFVGTWKLNLAKSTLSEPNADIASQTMTISETGPNDRRTIIDVVLKSGKTQHQEYNRIVDGKEHPATGVGFKQEGATEIVSRVNESTLRITGKRDGKETGVITSTVSRDGKVMTNRRTRNLGEEVLVFEKQ